MNLLPKTYYWLLPIGILSGLLICMIDYFLIKVDSILLQIIGAAMPGLVLTLFNTLVLMRINQPQNPVLKTSILGGLLTFLIYIASALIILPLTGLGENFVLVGVFGIVAAIIARWFFAVQFQVPSKPLNIISFCITGFCTGMMIVFVLEIDYLQVELLPDLQLNSAIGYILFTTLFNICLFLAFLPKNYKLVHAIYLLLLLTLTIDLFLRTH